MKGVGGRFLSNSSGIHLEILLETETRELRTETKVTIQLETEARKCCCEERKERWTDRQMTSGQLVRI